MDRERVIENVDDDGVLTKGGARASYQHIHDVDLHAATRPAPEHRSGVKQPVGIPRSIATYMYKQVENAEV